MNSKLLIIAGLTLIAAAGCDQISGSPLSQDASQSLEVQAYRCIYQSLLDPQDPRVRGNAIEVVIATHYARFMPKVQQLLRDPSVPVRFQAAIAVGDLRYLPAEKDVKQIYGEAKEDVNVRMAAAYALNCLGSPQYAEFIYQQINSKDMTVRANAALLLGKTGNRSALRHLKWALSDSASDGKVQLQALESIAMLGDTSVYPKLWTRLISVYADDRIAGIRAMGALRTQQAGAALLTMLDDDVEEVRLAAAEQLGKLGDPSGEPQVRKVLEKPLSGDATTQIRIKILAAMAVGEIGTQSLAEFLPTLLNDPAKMVRLAAAKAVFRRREK